MSPDDLAQLFQPFNRLGQEGKGQEGTGIGLVMAKRLVALMGGTLGVESAVGAGSVFWFEMNAAEGETEPVATKPAPVPDDAPGRTLLYIDDIPANLKLVERTSRAGRTCGF